MNRSKLIRDVLDRKTDLDSETKNNYNTLSQLQETRDSIKKELNVLKDRQLARMCTEFLVNDYERRFLVSQKKLFSALVGEDQAHHEISRLKYEHKVIYIM